MKNTTERSFPVLLACVLSFFLTTFISDILANKMKSCVQTSIVLLSYESDIYQDIHLLTSWLLLVMTTFGDTYPQSVPVSPKSVVRSPQSTVHTFQFASRSPRSTVHKQRSEVDGVSPPCTVCSLHFTVRGPQSKIFCLQSVIFVNCSKFASLSPQPFGKHLPF